MATKKATPAQETPAQKPTREQSTAYLAGVVTNLIKGEKVEPRDYKLAIGYIDGRRGGLSDTGLSRFSEVAEVKSLHDAAREAYPAKAKQILTDHKDILLKMFDAKPGQKSINKEEYSKVAAVLEEPLSRPTERGGLLREAHKVAKEMNATDITDAAAKYRETVRVHVLSPSYLAGIYTRLNSPSKVVSQEEKDELKKGITVLEGDKLVDKPFVENGRLTKFAVEVCNNARRMLGGKKGEIIDQALQMSENRLRRSQITPPKAPKAAAEGPDMD